MNSCFLKLINQSFRFITYIFFSTIYLHHTVAKDFKEYHENGKLKTSGKMKDNQMTGLWQRYREDGSQVSEGKWKNNHPIGFWKHLNQKNEVEEFGNYSCEQKIGLWKERIQWKFYRPKKLCLGYWLSFFRIASTYNHQNSREYSYSFNLSWNPELYNFKQFILGLGLGTDFLKEQVDTVDNENVGKDQTYPSFFFELQMKYAFTNSAPNQLEFFIGQQEFSQSDVSAANIYGLRFFLHNRLVIPQLIDKFFLSYKKVDNSDINFDQVSVGIKFNF